MKPAKPVPTTAPFLSLYTPTYRRPVALARCLESVGRQTAADDLEQLVVPDHSGFGVVGGLYGRLPFYAPVLRGRYVNLLCDDDVLTDPTVVARVRDFAAAHGDPEVIVTRVRKGHLELPACDPVGPPECGAVDLTSYLVRGDIWHRHVKDYGLRYEGDFDHASSLYAAGYRFAFCDLLWAVGGASHGRPEMDY